MVLLLPTSQAGPPPRAVKLSSRDRRRRQGLEDPGSAIDAKSHNLPTHRDQKFPEDLLPAPANP